jgi:tubulin-specific chaperone D
MLITFRVFLLSGILSCLAQMMRAGTRKLGLSIVEPVWSHVMSVMHSDELSSNALGRKLCVKVIQRCCLAMLDPLRINATARRNRSFEQRGAHPHVNPEDEVLALTATGIRLVPQGIDELLKSLRDKDTVVRWSAAKGLGRISARLPSSSVRDINDALIELFSPIENDAAWQGACLAVAEIARQGLLPPDMLPHVCISHHPRALPGLMLIEYNV